MPVELISPGPVTTLLANVTYALPATPCMVKSGAALLKCASYAGIYTNWIGSNIGAGVYHQGGGHTKCGIQTTVVATKIKMGSKIGGYSQVILNDKPSHYWRLNEPGGGIADTVGEDYGDYSGGITLNQPGAISNDAAMLFGGVDGKVYVSSLIKFVPPCSCEFWFRSTLPGIMQGFTGQHFASFPTGPEDRITFMTYGGTGLIECYIIHGPGDAGRTQITMPATNKYDGNWHHVVWNIKDSTTVECYIDKIFTTPDYYIRAKPIVGSPACAWDMGITTIHGAFLNGSLDEVAIYPYALSAAQVAKHYQARS